MFLLGAFFGGIFNVFNMFLGTYIPQNLAIYTVFHEESEFSGPRKDLRRPDRVFWKNVIINILKIFVLYFF